MTNLDQLINPTQSHRDPCKQVYGFTRNGARWSIVTDGHMLVAIPGGDFPDFPSMEILLLLVEHFEKRITIDRATMLAWLEGVDGAMPSLQKCGDCDGSKEEQCECERCGLPHVIACVRCSGTGQVCEEREAQLGRIKGRTFNRRFIKRALEAVGIPEQMTMSKDPEADGRVCLSADGWIISMMPMRVNKTQGPELLP